MSVKVITRPVGPLQANCYLVYNAKSAAGVVIDPGGDVDLIIKTAQTAGARIKAILITHGHHDHLGAAPELAKETRAEICGSSEVEAVLADPDRYSLFPGMPKVTPAKVDRILKGGEVLAFDGLDMQVVATPGHSPGSLTFFTTLGLFCGDLLFHGSIGRTDLPGGSFEQLASSVKRLVLMFPPQTTIYPGHGNTSTLEQEKENNPFLTDLGW